MVESHLEEPHVEMVIRGEPVQLEQYFQLEDPELPDPSRQHSMHRHLQEETADQTVDRRLEI